MNEHEAERLKNALLDIQKSLAKEKDASSLYQDLPLFKPQELQDISFQSDLARFKEEDFVLSVIVSIIEHPHFSSRGEEEIVRIQEASYVLPDMFMKTSRDPTLWRKDRGKMSPEYIYHLKSVDDLRIYENIFIIKVLEMISLDILASLSFYSYLVGNLSSSTPLSGEDGKVQEAFTALRKIERKVKRIKETWFYREVSKAKPIENRVQPTNILLKDNLYNYCYRYYRKMISSFDAVSAAKGLTAYFFLLILKELKEGKWSLNKASAPAKAAFQEGSLVLTEPLIFTQDHFRLTLSASENARGLELAYQEQESGTEARHLLLADPDLSFQFLASYEPDGKKTYDDVISLSIWGDGLKDKDKVSLFNLGVKENQAVSSIIESFTSIQEGSGEIYSSYCPYCGAKQAEEKNGAYACQACGASWAVLKGPKTDRIWLKSLVKRG
jgi:hypothetical protein